jgi:hypothetical protein
MAVQLLVALNIIEVSFISALTSCTASHTQNTFCPSTKVTSLLHFVGGLRSNWELQGKSSQGKTPHLRIAAPNDKVQYFITLAAV